MSHANLSSSSDSSPAIGDPMASVVIILWLVFFDSGSTLFSKFDVFIFLGISLFFELLLLADLFIIKNSILIRINFLTKFIDIINIINLFKAIRCQLIYMGSGRFGNSNKSVSAPLFKRPTVLEITSSSDNAFSAFITVFKAACSNMFFNNFSLVFPVDFLARIPILSTLFSSFSTGIGFPADSNNFHKPWTPIYG
ncbi:hypothetical protein AGLY_014418 [Aphis glycines]|uniref:Uncharacterized protein n=1 Tax=Aphis glycines TaxID=307491 RepID=A0A6G0T4Q2_APHGL|nr:hypothetical protein AGLY_014418 [Aphis glycines]